MARMTRVEPEKLYKYITTKYNNNKNITEEIDRFVLLVCYKNSPTLHAHKLLQFLIKLHYNISLTYKMGACLQNQFFIK